MKKILFSLFVVVFLSSCGAAYNSALKQIDLGMTKQEVVSLMGDKYTEVDYKGNSETIKYVDRYKNHWYFTFVDGQLSKWYKEVEQK